MEFLNEGYNGKLAIKNNDIQEDTGFRFVLRYVDHYDYPEWYYLCDTSKRFQELLLTDADNFLCECDFNFL